MKFVRCESMGYSFWAHIALWPRASRAGQVLPKKAWQRVTSFDYNWRANDHFILNREDLDPLGGSVCLTTNAAFFT